MLSRRHLSLYSEYKHRVNYLTYSCVFTNLLTESINGCTYMPIIVDDYSKLKIKNREMIFQ